MDRYKRSILKKNKIYRPYTIFRYREFYFSPDTTGGGWVYLVNQDGDVGDNISIHFSYGRKIKIKIKILQKNKV